MRMFLVFFGGHRSPATLSQRDWDRFIRKRRSGQVGHYSKPASNSTIAGDLTFLITVLNWAARSRDEHGRLFLQSNPLKGLKKPVRKNPRRVLVTEPEYEALLGVSLEVNWRFHVALVLAHRGTGSAPSVSSGGRTSTSRAEPSGGVPSTRRPATRM